MSAIYECILQERMDDALDATDYVGFMFLTSKESDSFILKLLVSVYFIRVILKQ